jgi:hypothetical protein
MLAHRLLLRRVSFLDQERVHTLSETSFLVAVSFVAFLEFRTQSCKQVREQRTLVLLTDEPYARAPWYYRVQRRCSKRRREQGAKVRPYTYRPSSSPRTHYLLSRRFRDNYLSLC